MKTLKATRLIFGGLTGCIAVLGSAVALAHPASEAEHAEGGMIAELMHRLAWHMDWRAAVLAALALGVLTWFGLRRARSTVARKRSP